MSNGNFSTSSGISQRTNTYAEVEMLKHAAPTIVLDRFGLSKPMPKNKGVNITFRRPVTMTAAIVPLAEGVTPAATRFRYENVEGALKQYGDVMETTDVIEDTHEDPVVRDMSIQAGENIGRTVEALNWGILRAGTNVFYANGAVRSAVNTPVSKSKIRAVVRFLKEQKAMKVTQAVSGSPNFQTKPVEPGYIAVCHTNLESDIRNLAGFVPCAEYGSRSMCHPEELGSLEDVRFISSPDLDPFTDEGGAKAGGGSGAVLSTSGTSADVYPILIFGKEAYGTVPLRGQGAITPTILPAGKPDKSDPLGQKGFVGWKMWHLTLILNELWIARLEVAAIDL